jgi:N-acetylglucosaminyl-diphospho-decaprenol L-rhamnosyltransferase
VSAGPAARGRVTVVVVTRDRAGELSRSLTELRRRSPGVPVIVVDNGSSDGSAEMVRSRHPGVQVIALPANRGGAGRNCGVRAARTPYVAFADDDSWWAEGALDRAAGALDREPRLAVLAARVLVGAEEEEDPTCAAMAASPLPRDGGAPGPAVLGFLACGAVVRRDAFLAAGGFHARFGIGGEEALLAVDLAARGWLLAYVDRVVAHHHPSNRRDPGARRRGEVRNRLWVVWLRRPLTEVLAQTAAAACAALGHPAARRGLAAAVAGLPWVLRERRAIGPALEGRLRLLEASSGSGPAG